ncbi:MAG TPA: hypothetical protein VL442_12665 [Mucilaginibacter sp.]|jgi:hypothetical protein|nr:hypothetical protein [Mucilaginibacter sp.]
MGEIIKIITRAMGSFFVSYFDSDTDVMSDDAKKIFANEDDRKKYIEAVEKLKNSNTKEETIVLSNHEKVTLVS